MAITFHPKPGQLLLCDFSTGFKEPEMVKAKRPVIVLSGDFKGRTKLVTVVPLSTKEPDTVEDYHYCIPKKSMLMLDRFQCQNSWVKGDMLYTLGFHRLDLIRLGTKDPNGKRRYYTRKLGKEQMKLVYACVLSGLNLKNLANHL